MPKYNKGDKVILKNDLSAIRGSALPDYMNGQEVVIYEVLGNDYNIKHDGERWFCQENTIDRRTKITNWKEVIKNAKV